MESLTQYLLLPREDGQGEGRYWSMMQNIITHTEITKAVLWVIITFVTLSWNLGNESPILLNLKLRPQHSAFIANRKYPSLQKKNFCPKSGLGALFKGNICIWETQKKKRQ